MNQIFIPDEADTGKRLDVFLASQTEQSRNSIQGFIRDQMVTVNGTGKTANYRISAGDSITLDAHPKEQASEIRIPDLPIVYEDADILVVDKPAHLTVHGGTGTAGHATVADFARLHTSDPDPERPGIVHRLDRDTSGLMVIAKSPEAKTYMQGLFREHKVQKTYQMLVDGHITPAEAVIKLPISRDPKHPLRRAVAMEGRPAITAYRTLATYPGYDLLEAKPTTGRTHQLRVHFATLGHPIAGDITYGREIRPLGLKRQFLHAVGLEFIAPSGEALKLTSHLPSDLQNILSNRLS